jgi:glucosamine--fructose-6-phosphate aminotransferase (isomerizing)
MCGIIGILGNCNCFDYAIDSLKMLLNRGYDSCGSATTNTNNEFIIRKYASTETISSYDLLKNNYKDFHNTNVNIMHTRWATHGEKSDINSHPHVDSDNIFAIVHNGIIENYIELKEFLIKNRYSFISQTDTEVIVNLISYHYTHTCNNDSNSAIQHAIAELKGTFALCIINRFEPNILYCIRNESPLLISFNKNYAIIGSEKSAFTNKAENYICLDNNNLCTLTLSDTKDKNNSYISLKMCNRQIAYTDIKTLEKTFDVFTCEPYPHWTIKEIIEQNITTLKALSIENMNYGRINDETVMLYELDVNKETLIKTDNIILLGCGTSNFACQESALLIKEICQFNTVQVFDGAEFCQKDIPIYGHTTVIFVSQSGETIDLYRCLKICKSLCSTIGVINTVDSLIAREVDNCVYLNAGKEYAVASTKAFTSQVVVLTLIGLWFSQNKYSNTHRIQRQEIIHGLHSLCSDIYTTIHTNINVCKEVAKYLLNKNSLFILGKNVCEPVAKEGSLKIKEIGYLHAEGYSSSALKHGPFALIQKGLPIILLMPNDEYYIKNKSTLEEIKSRHAYIIGISDQRINSDKIDIEINIQFNKYFRGILANIPLQLIAYELAILKGHNPDFPRNLAKCVTVD